MPFLLTREPWIPCTTPDGRRVDLGLHEVFARAHQLTAVHDASPLVTLAMHRLLLAILHRVFGPPNLDAWRALYKRGSFDAAKIDAYLEEWASRFDLLHPERPFYQTRGLAALYEPDDVRRLVLERSNYGAPAFVFQHRPTDAGDELSLAEAARGLLTLHAFSPGGLVRKAGEPGSASAGPLNRGAYVLLRGTNVFETLVRNLVVYQPEDGSPLAGDASRDRPSWEQPPLARPVGEREPRRRPHGWIDLLTWQSRRAELALTSDGQKVVGVVYCVAQGLDFEGLSEPMLAYKTDGKNVFAVGLSENRALWRDCHALIRVHDADGAARAPASVRQAARRVVAELFPAHVDLDVLGMCGDQAKILLTRAERLSVPAALLESAERAEPIREALEIAEGGVRALRDAVRTSVSTSLSPGDREPDRDEVRRFADSLGADARYWGTLAVSFEALLDAVARSDEAALDRFVADVRDTATESLRAAAESLGTSARQLQGTARAEVVLRAKLRELKPTDGDAV